MSLDATVSGTASNSYVTLTVASAYFTTRLESDVWDESEIAEQEAALVMATQRLDTEPYIGYPTTTTQRLQWPRLSVPNRSGWLYASDSIPEPVVFATCELALALLGDPSLFDGSGLEGFSHIAIPSLDITPHTGVATSLPAIVQRLLAPVRSGGWQARVVRA